MHSGKSFDIDRIYNMKEIPTGIDLLFETSWEVCNKIGGIYTVLSTKAKTLQTLYKDKTIFIGPDVWSDEHPSPYFTESASVLKDWKREANLPEGVSVRTGRWNVPGKPLVVLVKFDGMYAVKDSFYGRMWELYGVDSLHAYGDYDEGCAFAHAAGEVIKSICNFKNMSDKKVIAHFDEWTTAMGLLYVKAELPYVGTIFTTHATCIGRSICGNGKPLYDRLHAYNGNQMAAELNMQSKHSLEKAAAHAADCFTTVSEITAIECEQLLEIRPQVVTPNGFESGFVPGVAKLKALRSEMRQLLLNVASTLTGIEFNDKETFIVTTSGRCEYRNKGIDVFIDSMARLRSFNPSKRVLAFIMVPAWCKEARADLRQMLGDDSKRRLDDPFLTHWLNNPGEDPVNLHTHRVGIHNNEESSVTLIYVPCYLNGNDGIFNRPYYDVLAGMDATVFPSYYEPWGYTPLESVAFGVPTVTTSLSGFGRWILSDRGNSFPTSGVSVIERTDGNYGYVIDTIAHGLLTLLESTPEERAVAMNAAKQTAAAAAWQYFIDFYVDAFVIALEKASARIGKPVKNNHYQS